MVHIDSVVKVDVIVREADAYRRVEYARRPVELPGLRTWIEAKEDLTLTKLVWAKDSALELQLRDVRNLPAFGADDEYLHEWAKHLGVTASLQKCRHA